MKHLILTLILSIYAICITAGPSLRVTTLLTQPDGTTITATLMGDEHLHYYVNAEGKPLTMDADGYYRQATTEEWEAMRQRGIMRRAIANAHRSTRAVRKNRDSHRNKAFGEPFVFSGKKRGLVILVNYSDTKMTGSDVNSIYHDMFNKVGYKENNHIGSLHDYYLDQSYGQFDITFDIVGPVTVSKTMAYYGENNNNGDDKHPGELIAEACRLADDYVDYNEYDWDGDGEVDMVYVLYAGYGENAGGSAKTIWPHEFTLDGNKRYYGDGGGAITLDGCLIDTYACSSELANGHGTTRNGIGTAAHEFSHCLGLPDTYDTDYEKTHGNGYGMDRWSVLDSGNYNGVNGNIGEVPTGFTAYERWFCGWLEFTELDSPCVITDMPSIEDSPCAYIIYNNGNPDECFIIENHQDTRWNKYVKNSTGNHGMLVTHIDYDEDAWYENEINIDAFHQRMTIIPANRQYTTSGTNRIGQLFPGSAEVTQLTNDSHYTSGGKLFNMNTDGSYYMNKPITDITESADGLISFVFMGGKPDAIKHVTACQSEDGYYTLSGIRLTQPTHPGTYIHYCNGNARKIIIK